MTTSSGQDIELVIFDCDGVLIDSEIITCRIEAEELNRLGYTITADEVIRRFTGLADEKMRAIIEADWQRPLPHDFSANVKSRVADSYRDGLKAIEGISEALAQIALPMCVASSSAPPKLRLGLEQTNLYEFFAPNIFSTTMVARSKPAPDLFLFAAEKMNIAADRCLVVEDSTAGVQAACAAGMRVLGFCGGSHCLPDHAALLLANGAQQIFSEMSRLPKLLGNFRQAATQS